VCEAALGACGLLPLAPCTRIHGHAPTPPRRYPPFLPPAASYTAELLRSFAALAGRGLPPASPTARAAYHWQGAPPPPSAAAEMAAAAGAAEAEEAVAAGGAGAAGGGGYGYEAVLPPPSSAAVAASYGTLPHGAQVQAGGSAPQLQ
jgi:hypothetical protein